MEHINQAVHYILSFKPYVMLPLIIFIIASFLKIRPVISVKACLMIGIGFIGIFLVFDYFVAAIGPATKQIVEQTGLQFNVLDVGWPPLASIAWSFSLAPLMILVVIAVNVIMLMLRLTRVINIDIWNFWHFIMTGSLVYSSTGSYLLAISAIIVAEIIMLKIGDITGPYASSYSGIPGVTITTLSAGGYFPFGLLGNWLIERIPYVNKLNADPEKIRKRLGIFGEPLVIGFILGAGLGVAAGYSLRQLLELAFIVSAVVVILPLMCGVLSDGLIPISEGMKEYVKKRFPHAEETYIGLDNAILQGDTAVIVTGLLLMPIAMILAFVLPGISFIPIGDLVNILALGVMIVVATRGNVIRSVIISIPLIIAHLYIAGFMASSFTRLSRASGFNFPGFDGEITSFFDGGLVWRFLLYKIFEGNIPALLTIPILLLMIFGAYKIGRRDWKKEDSGK